MISGNFEESHPWIATECFPWLQRVIELDPIAKSCGRKGFQILHGVLEKEIEVGGSVTSHFLARCAPTYYGMMTVVFHVSKSVMWNEYCMVRKTTEMRKQQVFSPKGLWQGAILSGVSVRLFYLLQLNLESCYNICILTWKMPNTSTLLLLKHNS